MNESTFQTQVVELAKLNHWHCYHTFDSRRSEPGFPDLVLVRPGTRKERGRIVYAELKTDTGKLSQAQKTWLGVLLAADAEAYVWRPKDFDSIAKVLSGRAA